MCQLVCFCKEAMNYRTKTNNKEEHFRKLAVRKKKCMGPNGLPEVLSGS
jgi:hypothetical protein